jgi:hypothetical protein
MAKQLDFDAYVRWRLTPEGGAVIKNFQSRCVSGRRNPALAALINDATMRSITLAQIEKMPFFGIVERFDESITVMQRYLEPAFPGMDYTYQHVNSSAGRARTIEERIARIQELLPTETYDLLVAHNQCDIEVYDVALRRFATLLDATAHP